MNRPFSISMLSDSLPSVAALRALPAPIVAPKAHLAGYYASGDGGHGWFRWDASSTLTDNGGTVFRPNSVSSEAAGRWLRIYDLGKVNAKWFGAIGDFTSHSLLSIGFSTLADAQAIYPHANSLSNEIDWCAIVAAKNTLDVIPSTTPFARCGELYLPKGGYLCDQKIDGDLCQGLVIRGDSGFYIPGTVRGSAVTLIYTPSTQWKNIANQGAFISLRSTYGCGLEDVGIQYSNPSYTGVLVDFSHFGGATFSGDYGSVTLNAVTAVRDTGRWDDDGWKVGMPFYASGTVSNNTSHGTVQSISSDGLTLTVTGGSFVTETVPNFGVVFYVPAADTQKGSLRRCYLGGGPLVDIRVDPLARACVSLWGAIDCQIDENAFAGTRAGIRMQEYAHGSLSYSNAHGITGNQFGFCKHAILNAGQVCDATENVFESTGGFMERAYLDDYPRSNASIALSFDFDATNKYITRSAGSWSTDGWHIGYRVNSTTPDATGNVGSLGTITNLDVFSDGKTIQVTGALASETTQTKYTIYNDDKDLELRGSIGDTFSFDTTANTITRVTGDWILDGWQIGASQISSADVLFPGYGGGGSLPNVLGVTSKVLTLAPGMSSDFAGVASTSARLYFTAGPSFLTIDTSWAGDQFRRDVWIEVQGASGLSIRNSLFDGNDRVLKVRELGVSGLDYDNNGVQTNRPPIVFDGLQECDGLTIKGGNRALLTSKLVQFRTTNPCKNYDMSGNSPNAFNVEYQQSDQSYISWRRRLVGTNALFKGGNVEVEDIGSGIIIKSPDGTRWLIKVDNSGIVSTTAL